MTGPGLIDCFRGITVLDFEYEVDDGDPPRVLCMVAYQLDQHLGRVRTIRLWRGEFDSTPPFDIGPDALIVGYSLWAEMTAFMTLGWKFPVHVFDLHTAYQATTNLLLPYNPDEIREKLRKRLSDACRAYGNSMKNPGRFGRGAGSDGNSTHFYTIRPASRFAITPQTTPELAEPRRLLAAEIGPAIAGRQSGRGARKAKQARILIAIAKFAHIFHTPAPALPHSNLFAI